MKAQIVSETSSPGKRFRNIAIKLLMFFSLLIFLTSLLEAEKENWLRALGDFLVVSNELQPADVIIVLSGDEERVGQAVSLYKNGLAKFIIMSGHAWVDEMKLAAVKAGVPADKILLEEDARHTFQHPIFIKPIMDAHAFKSAIVVSSPYHMRRSAMVFKRAFHKTGIQLFFCPAEHSWFKPDSWWKSVDGRRIVLSEYLKLAVNRLGANANDAIYEFVGRK